MTLSLNVTLLPGEKWNFGEDAEVSHPSSQALAWLIMKKPFPVALPCVGCVSRTTILYSPETDGTVKLAMHCVLSVSGALIPRSAMNEETDCMVSAEATATPCES